MRKEYFKEKLTWLRLWLTILIAMVSACFAWLINNSQEVGTFLILCDIFFILGLTVIIFSINQKIRNYIEHLLKEAVIE